MPPPLLQLQTPRLRLRQWQPEDYAPFAELNADPRVMACFPAPLEREASDALAERMQGLLAERGWGIWAIALVETGEFIGCAGLNIPTAELPFSPCVEIAWRLAHAHWGKGLALEAAKRVLAAGFNELGLPEIVAFTALQNQRSWQLMRRLGMVADGEFQHPQLPENHPLRPHCLYRISTPKARA